MTQPSRYTLDVNPYLDTPSPTESGVPDYLAYLPNDIGVGGSFHISISFSESNELEFIQEYAWRSSPVPMWSSVLKKLKGYESRYNLTSAAMYDAYKTNQLRQQNIPSKDLRDWVNSYLMYAY